ncbi:hypothetical protein [Cyanobium sp. NIES-981]|uniref:hypothetical protein n=1 Tax=Cyanobium sp. NIES-981 TaxID=1851505 RepID=UPI0007DCD6D1|nr:hypothetical protein [Cyanobium sp. NIES-981]SBO44684.1 conserved protein of unknown function [Cyanobium sp. NIES-981]
MARHAVRRWAWALGLTALPVLLAGCLGLGNQPRPDGALSRQLAQLGSQRDPSLGDTWLALINGSGGRERVILIDLRNRRPVALPGLNRPDAQPISVSVDSRGDQLALVRQLEGRTELVLYRRSSQGLRPIPMVPAGVPRQVQVRADGRQLAVQVSRNGLWQIDLIPLP